MKSLKLFALACIVSVSAGCVSNTTTDNKQYITVNASSVEAKTILFNRSRSNETLCVDKTGILDCELLGVNATDPRQFMRFVFVDKEHSSKIFITHWLEVKDKKGNVKRNDLDLSPGQLDRIEVYIEKHRNKLVQN